MAIIQAKKIKTPKKISDSNSRLLLSAIKKGTKDNLNIVSHNSEIQVSFGSADKSITDYLQSLINTTPSFSINYVEGLDVKSNLATKNGLTQEKQYKGLNTSWVTDHEKTHLEFQFIKTRNTHNWAIANIINNVMDQLKSLSPRIIIEIPYHWIDQNNLDSFGVKFITIMDTINYQLGNGETEVKTIVDTNNRFTKDFYFMNNRGIHIPHRDNKNKAMINGFMDLENVELTFEMETYLKEMFNTYLKKNVQDLQDLFLAYSPQTNPPPPSLEESKTTHKTVFTKEHKDIDIENPERNKKDEFYSKINSHDWYLEYISQFEIEKTTNTKHEVTTDDEVEIYTVTEYKFKDLHTEDKINNYYSVTMPKDSTFKNVATIRSAK